MMLARLLAVLLAVTVGCRSDKDASKQWLALLPWETRDNLLQLHSQLDVKLLTGPPIPLYRPDLGDQIAYWLISYNDNQYAVVSASQQTRDSMLIMQGDNPSPLVDLQLRASKRNSTCQRYVVMTPSPDLNMACDTEYGRLMERILEKEEEEKVTELWEKMRMEYKEVDYNASDHSDNHTILLQVISASQPSFFPVAGIRDVYIRSLGQSDGSALSVQELCVLLGVCDEQGKITSFRETEYGEVYVHLEPVHEGERPKFEHDLHFEVVGIKADNVLVSKGFAVEPSHRAKRQSSYTYYSINNSDLMPDYDQFEHEDCQVGSGPVAWAQVFGFFDRRSHSGNGDSASQALYRCGSDGTTGSDSCQAPQYNDDRTKEYIIKMNEILRTVCISGEGSTLQSKMDDVETFFKDRQGSGAEIVLKTSGFFLGQLWAAYWMWYKNPCWPWGGEECIYSNSELENALSYIDENWPVIVGFRVSGQIPQHYAVMTQYRTRTVRQKVCKLISECETETVEEIDMYLHMGLGGRSNGWRKAEILMAAIAKY